ncbi:hypothetical protein SADUNF_Sadunf02G0207800 [Salix dunnii]|uniref:Uncharacterized protein n=1 Tax=Salix dunnii TaxID=1413687 RepID=A0A835N8V4_9ROSI|nr:hypothetical protein SADUNF_Sadunf02G0207800 [Salix dunnii]
MLLRKIFKSSTQSRLSFVFTFLIFILYNKDLTISPERIIRKLKSEKNGFHYKDILKVPHPSPIIPCFGSGSTSVHSCSESAISFSQKQMRDIESITTILTKELNSMKDIVQETWQSKVYPAMPLKYRADEKLPDKASATCGNAVNKEKRKIVFADEAGGKLQDVKTFENDRTSVTGSSSDKSNGKMDV